MKAINSSAVAIMRYDAGVLEGRFDKLKELDRLYVSRKREEEDWWVVKVQLEVKKIFIDGTLRIRMKICFKQWNMSGFWCSERMP